MRFGLLLSVALLTVLVACGLKRNLELPGHEKHGTKTQTQQATPATTPAATGTPAPAPAPTTSTPTQTPAVTR